MEINSITPKPASNTRCWRLFLMVSSACYVLISPAFFCVRSEYTLFMETRAVDVILIGIVIQPTIFFTGCFGFFGAKRRRVKTLIMFNIMLVCTIVAEIIIFVRIAYTLRGGIQETLMGYTIEPRNSFVPNEKDYEMEEKDKFRCCGFQGLEHYKINETGFSVKAPDFCYSFLKYDNEAYRILKETGQCSPLFESYMNSSFIVFALIVIANTVIQVLNLIFAYKLIKYLRCKGKLQERQMFSRSTLNFYYITGCRMDQLLLNEEEDVTDDRDEAPIRAMVERCGPANAHRGEPVPFYSARAIGYNRLGAADWAQA